MQLLKYFKDLTLHPKNAAELKGLILQLAVQGKLTKNWRKENPNTEPASVLLEQIQSEKEQLTKDGKIKKEKPLSEIVREEIEFDLPEHWSCCRLGNVIEIIRGITFPSSEKSKVDEEGKIPCLRTANVQESIVWDDLLYIKKKFVKRKDQILKKGDVIMSMANSRELVGKVAIIDIELEREFTLGGFISAMRVFQFEPSFLMVLLRSPKIRGELISSSSQTTNIANVSIGKLRPLTIPFPPLEEQKAIVSIVNQLFAEVEQLEEQTKQRIQLKEDFATSVLRQLTTGNTQNEWAYLKPLFATFFTEQPNIKKLRESILQLAVQGKLTTHWRMAHPLSPHLGGDAEGRGGREHASILLERIKAEKKQLVKDKKINVKDVGLKFIDELEKYFLDVDLLNGNTTGRYIKFTKTVCLWASSEREIKAHPQLNKVKGYSDEATKVFLTIDELETIDKTTFERTALENAKDWLIIGCFIGQRVSDLLRLTSENITVRNGLELIELTQKKIGKRVVVPLHHKVKATLDKRNGNFPYYISDVKFNIHIKDVCKLAGITEPTEGGKMVTNKNTGKTRKEFGTYPKHELISSHVCRRSYATNFYGEMPTSWLISITAHSTERQFLEYVGKSEIDTAQQIADFYAKQQLQAKKEPQMTVLSKAN